LKQTFSKYRIINELTGNIVYHMMINDISVIDHHEKLYSKIRELSSTKNIPEDKLFYETLP
jgi:hypothetical protein